VWTVAFGGRIPLSRETTISGENAENKGDPPSKLIAAVALVSLCSALTIASEKKVVRPPGAQPSASWSHGILVGDTLYISGMVVRTLPVKFPEPSRKK
jgi:enamine deaminase RidA (YjgF/YER057c/UK114 family)